MDWNEFLHEAVVEKDADLVQQALAQGADPNQPDDESPHPFVGRTPLYWAVSGGNREIVGLLLDAGSRIAAEAQAELSSLHAAVQDMNLPTVALLLEYDAAAALDWFDDLGRTPLMIAVELGAVQLARRLVEAGANINAHDEAKIGDTALRLAVEKEEREMVELLLAAEANPIIPGWMGLTPLDEARERKRGDGPCIYERLEQAAERFRK